MIRKNTWGFLAIFVLLLGVTITLQITGKLDGNTQSTPNPTEPSLYKLDMGKFNQVSIQKSNGQSLDLTAESDGKWIVRQPKNLTLQSDQILSAVSTLQGWTINRELNPTPPLDSMGLNVPSEVIQLTRENGQKNKISVGKLTPSGSGYYVQIDERAPVIVSKINVDNVLQIFPTQATGTVSPRKDGTLSKPAASTPYRLSTPPPPAP